MEDRVRGTPLRAELRVPSGRALTRSPAPLGPLFWSHKCNPSCWRRRRNLRHGRIILSIIFPTLLVASWTIWPSLGPQYSGRCLEFLSLQKTCTCVEVQPQLPGRVAQASPVVEVESYWEPRGPDMRPQARHLIFIRCCFIVYITSFAHNPTLGVTLEHSSETSSSRGRVLHPYLGRAHSHRLSRTF